MNYQFEYAKPPQITDEQWQYLQERIESREFAGLWSKFFNDGAIRTIQVIREEMHLPYPHYPPEVKTFRVTIKTEMVMTHDVRVASMTEYNQATSMKFWKRLKFALSGKWE